MKHNDALSFLQKAQIEKDKPQRWLDLGCGSGTFTNALAALLAAGSEIVAVDKAPQQFKPNITHSPVHFLQADFTTELLPVAGVDGIFMSNALHYVADQKPFIQRIETYFAKQKQFLIVEYDREKANQWVPFPLSFERLRRLFSSLGYFNIQKLNERPSAYGQGNMYLAHIQ